MGEEGWGGGIEQGGVGTEEEDVPRNMLCQTGVIAWNPESRAEERSGDTAFRDGFQARGFGVEGDITSTFITSQRSREWVVWKRKARRSTVTGRKRQEVRKCAVLE
ncbi:hypothetical protein Bbelb_365520 [Branchiostoma belcheri]|nr:hypothetical protein Bbelb_365520 [Branchiostoma belcheri]